MVYLRALPHAGCLDRIGKDVGSLASASQVLDQVCSFASSYHRETGFGAVALWVGFLFSIGDLLSAGRYAYIVQCSDPEKVGTELENRWCDMLDDRGLTVKPEHDPDRDLGFLWQGFTVSQILPTSIEVGEENHPIEQARNPTGLRVPGEPTEAERRQHELTHLPFRSWCKHCTLAKGRHAASRRLNDRQPVIQVDYCLTRTDPKLEMQTLLVATGFLTGLSMSVVVPRKGE